jgi:hypothetical protein
MKGTRKIETRCEVISTKIIHVEASIALSPINQDEGKVHASNTSPSGARSTVYEFTA